MKIFLSAVEGSAPKDAILQLIQDRIKFKYNLMSYYYIRNNNFEHAVKIRDNSEEIMIDSGAHSFQFGTKVNFEEYTREYAEFIKKFDTPNVVGYFEMDVDNVIGYDKVLELRKILEEVSDKIIPVWHPNRGIEDFKQMCKKYKGKVISITGFAGKEVRDDQYIMFLKYAKKYNCKMHCLGMTRKKILKKVPFDYVDSSSWLQSAVYGRSLDGRKLPKMKDKEDRKKQYMHNYILAMNFQKKFYDRWRRVCKD